MDQHLDAKTLSAFRLHQLSGPAASAAAAHLAACRSCRGAAGGGVATLAAATLVDETEHLPEDLVVRYADQVVDDAERSQVERHIEACASCGEEVADLRRFVEINESVQFNRNLHRDREVRPYWAAAAAAVLAAIISTVLLMQNRQPVESTPVVASAPAAQTATDGVPAQPQPSVTASVRDNGGEIALLSDGNIRGAELTSEESSMVRSALTSRALPENSIVASLASASAALLRGPSTESRMAILQPVGSAVLDETPTFRWTALDAATSYRVSVSTEDFQIVAESPALTATSWSPATKLGRGATYTWQVVAQTPRGEVVAPGVAGSEAKFHVVSAETSAALASLAHQKSHLVRGLAYAKHGLLLDAEAELEKLVAADPKSPIAKGLLAQVREKLPRR